MTKRSVLEQLEDQIILFMEHGITFHRIGLEVGDYSLALNELMKKAIPNDQIFVNEDDVDAFYLLGVEIVKIELLWRSS